MNEIIREHLIALFGKAPGEATFAKLTSPPAPLLKTQGGFQERGAILITYGDQLREPDRAPLRTLAVSPQLGRVIYNYYTKDQELSYAANQQIKKIAGDLGISEELSLRLFGNSIGEP